MPFLDVKTNVKVDGKEFAQKFSKFAAETLAMPEVFISVGYTYVEALTFNGTFDPVVQMTVTSLGLSPEKNEKCSKSFFDYFAKHLGLPGDRGYINFVDPGGAHLGYKGTTFATILGES